LVCGRKGSHYLFPSKYFLIFFVEKTQLGIILLDGILRSSQSSIYLSLSLFNGTSSRYNTVYCRGMRKSYIYALGRFSSLVSPVGLEPEGIATVGHAPE